MQNIYSLPAGLTTLKGSSFSSGSLNPTSFLAKILMKYSLPSERSWTFSLWTSDDTRPTSIHICRLASRTATL